MRSRACAAVAALVLGGSSADAAGLAFPIVDSDHDGFVTWEEAHDRMPMLAQVHFRKCDANGDGVISRNEYPLLSNFYWSMYVRRD